MADRIRSTFLEHAGGRFGILNSLSLSGSLSLASAKTVPLSERRKILPFTLARAKYAPLSIVASVAQLAEQLTLNQLVDGSSPSRGTTFSPMNRSR